jgi:membrane protein DedA with SNARE-associated domain
LGAFFRGKSCYRGEASSRQIGEAQGSIVGLECIGFPLPGQMALLAAAVYAGTKHDLDIVSVVITVGATAIVGRTIGYLIGRE